MLLICNTHVYTYIHILNRKMKRGKERDAPKNNNFQLTHNTTNWKILEKCKNIKGKFKFELLSTGFALLIYMQIRKLYRTDVTKPDAF